MVGTPHPIISEDHNGRKVFYRTDQLRERYPAVSPSLSFGWTNTLSRRKLVIIDTKLLDQAWSTPNLWNS